MENTNSQLIRTRKHSLCNLTVKEVLKWIDEAYVNYSNVQLIELKVERGSSYNKVLFTVEYEEDGYWSGQ